MCLCFLLVCLFSRLFIFGCLFARVFPRMRARLLACLFVRSFACLVWFIRPRTTRPTPSRSASVSGKARTVFSATTLARTCTGPGRFWCFRVSARVACARCVSALACENRVLPSVPACGTATTASRVPRQWACLVRPAATARRVPRQSQRWEDALPPASQPCLQQPQHFSDGFHGLPTRVCTADHLDPTLQSYHSGEGANTRTPPVLVRVCPMPPRELFVTTMKKKKATIQGPGQRDPTSESAPSARVVGTHLQHARTHARTALFLLRSWAARVQL